MVKCKNILWFFQGY